MRVVQISDLHLSRSHSYFYDNWRIALDILREDPPDLTIVSGDVSFNGADSREDLAFAREQLEELPAPWVVIPGNHDVGDHPLSKKLDQPVNAERYGRWMELFGDDRFLREYLGFRIAGIATALMGSGLPREEEQWRWIRELLDPAAPPTMLVLHKPLFARSIDETEFNKSCVDPESRARLRLLLQRGAVPLVASAHVHVYKNVEADGIEFVWCPATSFVVSWEGKDVYGGVRRAGWIEYEIAVGGEARDGSASGSSISIVHRWIEPPLLVNYDLRNWFIHTGSTVSMPPRPLRG